MGYVYFIEMNRPHLIKVGYARDVLDRLSNLQTASPFELSVLDAFHGTKEDERTLQRMLAPHRYRREWFRPADDVLDLLEELELYRQETFEKAIFDRAVHKAHADIWNAVDDVPITGFFSAMKGTCLTSD